jgi:hypothetical protein
MTCCVCTGSYTTSRCIHHVPIIDIHACSSHVRRSVVHRAPVARLRSLAESFTRTGSPSAVWARQKSGGKYKTSAAVQTQFNGIFDPMRHPPIHVPSTFFVLAPRSRSSLMYFRPLVSAFSHPIVRVPLSVVTPLYPRQSVYLLQPAYPMCHVQGH